MSWSRQCEKGCVPAEAILSPALPAREASLLRSSITCSRAFEMDEQISVPSSTTDWCISGLICSFSSILPPSRTSLVCERDSRGTGYDAKNALGKITQRPLRHRGLDKLAPAQIIAARLMFRRFPDRHVGN